MQTIKSIIFATISAFLLFLSTPGYGYYPLAFVSFIPIFYGIGKYGKVVLPSLFFALVFYMMSLKWIVVTVSDFGNAPLIVGVLLLFLLSCYLSLYFIVFFILYKKRENVLLLASVFAALEIVRGWAFTGFPWMNLGLTQYKNPIFLKLYPVMGESGVSFLIVLVNLLIFSIFFKKRKKNIYYFAIILMFVFVCNFINYGNTFKSVKVSVIQPGYAQSDKWNPAKKNELIESVLDMLIDNVGKKDKDDVLILPESVFPTFCSQEPELMKLLKKVSYDTPLIFGCLTKENEKLYNSIYFLNKGKMERYDKIHLVPFGEYFPFKNLLKPVEYYFFQDAEDFSKGNSLKVVEISGVRYAGLLCFESAFAGMVKKVLRKKADVLVFLTNDSWFGKSNGRWQHYAIDFVRGLEFNRPVVRATQSGISACINPFKSENVILTTGEKGVLTCNLSVSNRNTVFGKIYYWWLLIILFISLIIGRKKDE